MSIQSINCTALRSSSSSFAGRKYDRQNDGNHRSFGEKVKLFTGAAIVGAAGAVATKNLSGSLLKAMTRESKLSTDIGTFVLKQAKLLNDQVSKLNPEGKIAGKVKKYSGYVIAFVKDFAKKGAKENANEVELAEHAIQKTLAWIAGGTAGLTALKDGNEDHIPDADNLVIAATRLFSGAVEAGS